ncbi:GDSL-type esterase/lipase family protein [Pedobacter sp. PLR]|uniref:GDSL-type esterase/lipase family protein n=1 Tax=Pedobacter sp. PLR TaxID=2994465 RepID=UPI002246EB96|nr:GDSL-type esterase/lipase family protein [Pedobacter sp. PLR]MCX2453899.1 GDSL-type esterase/lipase family protein [Pedobacter sp. PLR]
MRTTKNIILVVWLLSLSLQADLFAQAKKIKVACIGNSVTAGYLLKDPAHEAYPSVLQGLLGETFEVGNFGLSGATLLKKGHRPYYKTKEFTNALNFQADIAIVHLGLNDTDPRNWPEYRDEFQRDYAWLLDTLKKNNPKIKLYVCRLTPIFSEHPRFKSGTRDWYWQIQKEIPLIAKDNQASLIDLNSPLNSRTDLFPDNLHPDQEGAAIIARTVYENLTGNYSGLKLPVLFTDHMVLQRDQAIPVYGTANADEPVTVTFNHQKKTTITGKDGKWKVVFPAMPHGGPYQMVVQDKKKKIILNDLLLGDVWLCSGQSNMYFQLKQSATGAAELKQFPSQPKLRLMKFNPVAETDAVSWDSTTLTKLNQLEYFSGNWAPATVASAAGFSAIGYYFGQQLVHEEGVPIGLIQMAVGGSTLESWIDRYTMEHDPQLVDALSNWRKSDFVQEWARGRANLNLKNAVNSRQRHPYEPAYNYEAGIAKLIGSPIKGVIWYQGESNTQNPELYAHSFPLLIKSWREKWGIDFPFYYVQLSGINRPSWPYFRDMQREVQYQVPNTYMAVSSDLGDSLDVHPTKKKEIGQRLALQALKHSYHRDIVAVGPVAKSALVKGHVIEISFADGSFPMVKSGQPLQGFELVLEKGMVLPVAATVLNNKVQLQIPSQIKTEKIRKVRYSYAPFSRANLVNQQGLPASTFSLPIN